MDDVFGASEPIQKAEDLARSGIFDDDEVEQFLADLYAMRRSDVASLRIEQRLPPALLRELLGAQIGFTFTNLGKLTRWATLRQWVQPAVPSSKPGSRPGRRSPTPTTSHVSGARSPPHATRRGRPRPQNDTWIAAACLAYDLPLATLNIKDFKDFGEHEGLTLLGV